MLQEFVQEISNLVERKLADVHTAVPGKIVSFDINTGLATVLPTMQFKKPDGTKIDYPQITGVPVVFPQSYSQNATIAFPVKSGDGCLLIIAEQSIDYWMYGQKTDTDLKHDLTNAICIPGLFQKVNSSVKEACNNNAIVIRNGSSKAVIKNGSIELHGSVSITGNLNVGGKISANGNISSGGKISASTDVTADGKSLKSHTHTDSVGGTTSAPN